jgi:hypothetical protein
LDPWQNIALPPHPKRRRTFDDTRFAANKNGGTDRDQTAANSVEARVDRDLHAIAIEASVDRDLQAQRYGNALPSMRSQRLEMDRNGRKEKGTRQTQTRHPLTRKVVPVPKPEPACWVAANTKNKVAPKALPTSQQDKLAAVKKEKVKDAQKKMPPKQMSRKDTQNTTTTPHHQTWNENDWVCKAAVQNS